MKKIKIRKKEKKIQIRKKSLKYVAMVTLI